MIRRLNIRNYHSSNVFETLFALLTKTIQSFGRMFISVRSSRCSPSRCHRYISFRMCFVAIFFIRPDWSSTPRSNIGLQFSLGRPIERHSFRKKKNNFPNTRDQNFGLEKSALNKLMIIQ